MPIKGYILAALAAAFYGTNPIFAVPLYGCGLNVLSILLFRYLLGIPFLAILLVGKGERLLPARNQFLPVATIGILMALSSLTLYESYKYMNAGVASTLLFMYPLLTSLLMTFFFHEKFRLSTAISLLVMGAGLYLMIKPGASASVDLTGFLLIFISSLTYAIYLVMVKICKSLREMHSVQSLLYQLLFGSFVYILPLFLNRDFILPGGMFEWANLLALAIIPTILSLLFTLQAIKHIGPTPTAIFGALEPVTAVILSIIILGETITLRETIGGVLILAATMLVIVAGKTDDAETGRNGG